MEDDLRAVEMWFRGHADRLHAEWRRLRQLGQETLAAGERGEHLAQVTAYAVRHLRWLWRDRRERRQEIVERYRSLLAWAQGEPPVS